MKTITTKRYQLQDGKKVLRFIDTTEEKKTGRREITESVDANGKGHKILERVFEDGRQVSLTNYSDSGKRISRREWEYFPDGTVKGSRTYFKKNILTHYETFHRDEFGRIYFIDRKDEFEYHHHQMDPTSGFTTVARTTYDKSQPFIAVAYVEEHRDDTGRTDMRQRYYEFEARDAGFLPRPQSIEERFEYHENGALAQMTTSRVEEVQIDGFPQVQSKVIGLREYDERGWLVMVKELIPAKGKKKARMREVERYRYKLDGEDAWRERRHYRHRRLIEIARRKVKVKKRQGKKKSSGKKKSKRSSR